MLTLRKQMGFTLSELLVVVAIAGVVATLAVPSYKSFMQEQQVKNASFTLFGHLSFARSEAIKRKENVTISPATGGWQNGWSISSSSVANLKTQGVLKGVVFNSSPSSVVYAKTGRTSASSNFQLDASTTTTDHVRCVKASLSGMPRSNKGTCS